MAALVMSALGTWLLFPVSSGSRADSGTTTAIPLAIRAIDPLDWIGRDFPLASEVQTDCDLSAGRWIVLMWSPSCTHRHDAIDEYRHLPAMLAGLSDASLMFVEISTNQLDSDQIDAPGIHLARLRTDQRWFASTPIVLLLSQGSVVQAWEGRAPSSSVLLHHLSMANRAGRAAKPRSG